METRSQSQQSMASTASSSQSQQGFLGQASRMFNSVLGVSKKAKPEPVKSLQLAAAAAKKVKARSYFVIYMIVLAKRHFRK